MNYFGNDIDNQINGGFTNYYSGDGADEIFGSAGANQIYGGEGNDFLGGGTTRVFLDSNRGLIASTTRSDRPVTTSWKAAAATTRSMAPTATT